jgi:hypothetical protein
VRVLARLRVRGWGYQREVAGLETTSPQIAGRGVGVGNIFERELPGLDGVVAERMSASVALYDPVTKAEDKVEVIVGSCSWGPVRHGLVRALPRPTGPPVRPLQPGAA